MTRVAIHQPNFLPYPGFFYKMAHADVFVLYDTAQFVRREYQNRNRIKAPEGTRWLTVPVNVRGFPAINSVRLDESQPWRARIGDTLRACYKRAPHFAEFAPPIIAALKASSHESLAQLNTELIRILARALGLRPEIRFASELPPLHSTNPSDRLAEITRAVGGNTYLSGAGALGYLRSSRFTDVRLSMVAWQQIRYPQLWGDFVPNLSIVDALFNCGDATLSKLFLELPNKPYLGP